MNKTSTAKIQIVVHRIFRVKTFCSLFQGKGTMLTYFLNGREGFTKPLPDLSKAAGLEEHNFK